VQLYGLLARWTVDPLLKLEAFGFGRVSRSLGDELDGSRFGLARLSGETFTTALRVSGEAKGWTYGAEGAYQFGKATSVAIGGADISAWAASANVSKSLEQLLLTPTFRLAGSYASGDDSSGTYKQFDPLLADPQRFHGQMDLFAWSNMMDVSARAQIVPLTDTTLAFEWRYAKLAQAGGEWIGSYLRANGRQAAPSVVTTPPGAAAPTATDLGHELDLVFAWRPWLPLELRAGYSMLLMGDAARSVMATHARGKRQPDDTIAPADIAHYAFGQATLNMP
jgi:hypothetical protein